MKKNILLSGPTLEDIYPRIIEEIPTAWYAVSMLEDEGQHHLSNPYLSSSVDEAIEYATLKVLEPVKINPSKKPRKITGHRIEQEHQKLSINISAQAEEDILALPANHSWITQNIGTQYPDTFKIKTVELADPGVKGFMGIGKRQAIYKVEYELLPVVTIEFKLYAEISIDITDDPEQAASYYLIYAAENNQKMVRLLLDQGIDINSIHKHNRHNALMEAIVNRHAKMGILLVQEGININHTDIEGKDVLHFNGGFFAENSSDQQLIDMLIGKGLKPPEPKEFNRQYCNKCDMWVPVIDRSYDYDDGWMTRREIVCRRCESILESGTTQN